MTYAEQLLAKLARAGSWPLKEDREMWARIALWIALRESDVDYLAEYSDRDAGRYMVDPIPEKISEAYADLVAGTAPIVKHEADQDHYDAIVKENQLDHLFHSGVDTQVSEGQLFWRIYVDKDVADWPLIDYHSRLGVVRLFAGRRLRAVGFFSRLDDPAGRDNVAWRHLEIHEKGRVLNRLFRGDDRTLGREVALTQHPDVATLKDEWVHDLPMLAGWIPNKPDLTGREGISEYNSIEGMLLELNESLETGKVNRRLTARKRISVPASALNAQGELDPEQEVVVMEAVDVGDDAKAQGQMRVLEYAFDAEALIAYQNDLALKAVTRAGIAGEFIGMHAANGGADTGVALRLKLIPSTNSGRNKNKPWVEALPTQLHLAARVAALPAEQGGYGASFADLETAPSVENKNELPEDPIERTGRLVQATTGEIMSRRTAIRELHPDWDDDQVDAEFDEIEEQSAGPGSTAAGGLTNLFAGRTASDRGVPPEDDPDPDADPPEPGA